MTQSICGSVGCAALFFGLVFSIGIIGLYVEMYVLVMRHAFKKYLDIDMDDDDLVEYKKSKKVRKVETHPIFKNK